MDNREKSVQQGPHNYSQIAGQPKLMAFYLGWIAQKICYSSHMAVVSSDRTRWLLASAEMDRVLLLHQKAIEAGTLLASGQRDRLLGRVLAAYGDGGWWGTTAANLELFPGAFAQQDREDVGQDCDDSQDLPVPRIAIGEPTEYRYAGAVMNDLAELVAAIASDLRNLDLSRIGAILSGMVLYSEPPNVPYHPAGRAFPGVFDDLAAHEASDRTAENAFRRALGVQQIDENRKCLPLDMVPLVDVNGGPPRLALTPLDDEELERLALSCVFERFGMPVPPQESDAGSEPGLAVLKAKLAGSLKVVKDGPKASGHEAKNSPQKNKKPKVASSQNRMLLISALLTHHRTDTGEPNWKPACESSLAKILSWSQPTTSRAMESLFGKKPMGRYRRLCSQERLAGFLKKQDDGANDVDAMDPKSIPKKHHEEFTKDAD